MSPEKRHFPVPTEVPGRRITDPGHRNFLRRHLATICGLENWKFPGAQPVSFNIDSMRRLETTDFWVCEKSDGIRVLVLVVTNKSDPKRPRQEIFFIDRKEDFYEIEGLVFPHQDGLGILHSNTVLDGELVIDVDPRTEAETLRFLAFDLIVVDNNILAGKALSGRYGRLKEWIIEPHEKLLHEYPHLRARMPFEVKLKLMELAYGIEKVLKDLPLLTHGNDGLIFTSAEAKYSYGTDDNILKWKPPHENSIDFRLDLRFPALAPDRPEVDFGAKPTFALLMNAGSQREEFFDTLEMADDEWERYKRAREQLDDRIVEVVWDAPLQTWKITRFRDDKREGNFKTVVFKVLDSIKDGVEADQLVRRAPGIRAAWKAREAKRQGLPPPVSTSGPPPSSLRPPPPPPPASGPDDHQPRYALQPSSHTPISGVAAMLNR